MRTLSSIRETLLKLRQIIGNAIADGEAEEMIVVFPDIYASDSQDKCDGLNDKNNKAYDNFNKRIDQGDHAVYGAELFC